MKRNNRTMPYHVQLFKELLQKSLTQECYKECFDDGNNGYLRKRSSHKNGIYKFLQASQGVALKNYLQEIPGSAPGRHKKKETSYKRERV